MQRAKTGSGTPLVGHPVGPPWGPCVGGVPAAGSQYGRTGWDRDTRQRAEMDNFSYRHRRLNCVLLFSAFFAPWLSFLTTFSVVAFYFRYVVPLASGVIVSLAFLGCIGLLVTALKAKRKGGEWHFHAYMAITVSCAVLGGAVAGNAVYWADMDGAFQASQLATYVDVEPSTHYVRRNSSTDPVLGQRYQDGGKIYFRHQTALNQSAASSFVMGDSYCVVPIVNPSCTNDCGTDFWAVGMNCCEETTDTTTKFQCGDYLSPRAKGGLRLISASKFPLFRLAVLQAEGIYNMVSPHPLFFYWTEDPVHMLEMLKKNGYRKYILAMIMTFLLDLCVLPFGVRFWVRKQKETTQEA